MSNEKPLEQLIYEFNNELITRYGPDVKLELRVDCNTYNSILIEYYNRDWGRSTMTPSQCALFNIHGIRLKPKVFKDDE